jgi:soluble P-type ATPase
MAKPGIQISIPSFGELDIRTICSDFTGTLSLGGKLAVGVAPRLQELAKLVDVHVVTSDTNNTAKEELDGLPVLLHRIESDKPHHEYKRDFVLKQGLQPRNVAVFGNGRNDRLWLNLVKEAGGLAIAVDVGEGCAVEAIENAHLFVSGIDRALDLLLHTNRVKATLRS